MKKLLLLGLYWLVTVSALAITTPEKINYQGVARSADGTLLVNQNLGIQIQIRTVNSNGDVVYSETHTVITNQYGLFSLQIGDGSVELGAFADIDWNEDTFVELSMDFSGGTNYLPMGTSQLVAVPYALHAKTADNVFSGNFGDLTNAPVNVSDFANDAGYITSANDADADATNEIQDLALVGSTLTITNNPSATAIDLSSIAGANTDSQTLNLTGTDLDISGGNTVDLSALQDGFEANTDTQLSEAEVDAFVANNGYISAEVDGDVTNEIQDLTLVGSTLKITNNATATEINLAPFSGTNTDEQTLSLTGTNLFITNGNAVSLASIQDGYEANTDAQTLSVAGTSLSIAGGNTVDISSVQDGFEANTDNQTLSLAGNNLTIAGGNTIALPTGGGGTDDQKMDVSQLDGTDLKLSLEADGEATKVIDLSSLKSQTLPTTTINANTTIDNSSQYIYINGIRELTLPANPTSGMILYINAGNGGATINANGKLFREDGVSLATPVSFTDLVGGKGTITISYYGTWDIFSKSSQPDETQTLSLAGNNLSISGGNTITIPSGGVGTDDQIVDVFTLSGTTLNLSLESDGQATKTVNLSSLQDGFEANTDNQVADVFTLSGTTLNLSLSGDGQATKTVNLASLQDGTGTDNQSLSISGNDITISGGNTITVPSGGAGTDDQVVDLFTLSGTTLNLSLESDGQPAKTVNLSSLQDGFEANTDTQLNEIQVDAFVANNGYLSSEVDGSTTNELQTLALSGTNLSISSKNTIDLSSVQDGTGTDTQTLSISGSTLSISNGNSVALPGGGGTDDQIVDVFTLSGTTLSLSLESDGQANKTVNLSSLQDGTGTDDQVVDVFTLSGTTLSLSLESDGQANKTVNLSSLQDGIGTDDQVVDVFSLSGTTLSLSLESDGQTNKTVDLSALPTGAFKTATGITSNSTGNYTTDDFVFGSSSLNSTGTPNEANRFFFDKSKAGFRAGYANLTAFDAGNIGLYSAAFGNNPIASGANSFAVGYYSTATATGAIAIGYSANSSDTYATALGFETDATWAFATAFGKGTLASKYAATAFGFETIASSSYATASGYQSVASGQFSTASGRGTSAQSHSSVAVGSYNTLLGGDAANWVASDPLFIIGNGASNVSRSTAVTVLKNGNVGIGFSNPTADLEVNGTVSISRIMHLDPQGVAPSGVLGDLYVRSDGKLFFHNGTTWKEVSLL